ncbi:N-acetylmuramoyl-L-alanine amidase, partial [Acinetobacter baumannii]
VLKYAQLIKTLNNNDHIEFILSRTDDKYMHMVEVTDFINNQNPDLAISIHANTSLSSLKDMNGSGVYLSKSGISFNESYTLANNIATNL